MTGSFVFPRVQAIPEIDRATLRIDGAERVAYNFGRGKNAPFLFPIVGASGAMLTRMGHPSSNSRQAERSIWLGHQDLAGVNFWDEQPGADVKIRHREIARSWDGPRGGMTIKLDWWARGQAALQQILELELAPTKDKGFTLDVFSRFESTGVPVELARADLGFLGIRVAKTMSESLGGGRVVSATGLCGAEAINGTTGRWVDYSGPSAPGTVEGICIMDHPANPDHPTHWNVQPDGLMCAAFNMASSHGVARDHPLDLRYRLLIHAGAANPSAFDQAWDDFARSIRSRPIA